MMICIVARCTENDSFIIGGDRLFSYSRDLSYESISLKRLPITLDRRWHTMFSGDVPNVLPVIRRARRELIIRRPPYRLEQVERACVQAYKEYREQLVNDGILGSYGIDLTTYRREGLNFGENACARINSLIENVRVGIQLIIYGYDDLNAAHLCTLSETTKPPFTVESTCREQDGIAIIGCGYRHAVAALLSAPLPTVSQAEMLCRVCEAKFEAEKDPDVGRDSAAGVVNRPRNMTESTSERFITLPALEAIRDAHTNGTDRPYPKALLEGLSYCIDSNITTERMHEAVWRAEQQIIEENRRQRAGEN
jgi:hypothetical protein